MFDESTFATKVRGRHSVPSGHEAKLIPLDVLPNRSGTVLIAGVVFPAVSRQLLRWRDSQAVMASSESGPQSSQHPGGQPTLAHVCWGLVDGRWISLNCSGCAIAIILAVVSVRVLPVTRDQHEAMPADKGIPTTRGTP